MPRLWNRMTDVRFSALCAAVAAAVAFVAFAISYWIADGSLPGYKVLAYPGIVATRLFSEETPFWPKLGIMLLGQYCAYFVLVLAIRRLAGKVLRTKD
jgi:hypothetical protein